MNKLVPCPFCGSEARVVEGADGESAYVQCVGIKMHKAIFYDGDNNAANEVAEQWNRRAVPTWQPIDTAPKDRAVLICGGTYDMPSNWGQPLPFTSVCIAFFNHRGEWQGDDIAHDEYYVHLPTNWMPLPPPLSPPSKE